MRHCQNSTARLLAGTVYFFAHPLFADAEQALDYLVIDEAGQVSLANVIAAGQFCKNIILLGDQMQLAQPIWGRIPLSLVYRRWSIYYKGKPRFRHSMEFFWIKPFGCILQSVAFYRRIFMTVACVRQPKLISVNWYDICGPRFLPYGLLSWSVKHRAAASAVSRKHK